MTDVPTNTPYGTESLDRAVQLLQAIVSDGGKTALLDLATSLGLAGSSARRVATLLLRRGLLVRIGPGHFSAGPAFLAAPKPRVIIADVARPALRRLARAIGATVHLGLLEDEMITYIAKAHGGGPEVLTREGMQLEAYCSAIGRVLLSVQPQEMIQAYLSSAPFVALTGNTETDPERIGELLKTVQTDGFAVEHEEIMEGLHCTAVPVPARGILPSGIGSLALSVARMRTTPVKPVMITSDRKRLEACAAEIAASLDALGQYTSVT